MSKISVMALVLTLAGGAAVAQSAAAPAQDAKYAQLVDKMDHAYNMQFKVPQAPEETAARSAPVKTAS